MGADCLIIALVTERTSHLWCGIKSWSFDKKKI